MKKMLNIITALVVTGICGAADVADNSNAASAELSEINNKIKAMLEAAPKGPHGGKLISPELKELMDRRSGGLVYPKTNGKALLLVDARGCEDDVVQSFAMSAKGRFHITITHVAKEMPAGADPFKFASECKTMMNPAVVLLVDHPSKPVLSIYPEDAIGIVNVAPLKSPDKGLFGARVQKETWRGIALALGGFATVAPNGRVVKSLLSPVYSTRDLDALKMQVLSPSQCIAVYEAVSGIGIQASRPVIYSVAVRQGWAPPPTNNIQRAIWKQVHAIPDKPITIEFDPKKDK